MQVYYNMVCTFHVAQLPPECGLSRRHGSGHGREQFFRTKIIFSDTFHNYSLYSMIRPRHIIQRILSTSPIRSFLFWNLCVPISSVPPQITVTNGGWLHLRLEVDDGARYLERCLCWWPCWEPPLIYSSGQEGRNSTGGHRWQIFCISVHVRHLACINLGQRAVHCVDVGVFDLDFSTPPFLHINWKQHGQILCQYRRPPSGIRTPFPSKQRCNPGTGHWGWCSRHTWGCGLPPGLVFWFHWWPLCYSHEGRWGQNELWERH